MKILPIEKIREADQFTIAHEPISDIDLMERAATACFNWMVANISNDSKVKVICGTGNNGGDGLAIARLMAGSGYKVDVYLSGSLEKLSQSAAINYSRLLSVSNCKIHYLSPEEDDPLKIQKDDVVIDAILGSGLARKVEGSLARLIRQINMSGAIVISIDVPSGLFCDESSIGSKEDAIIQADYTLTFSPPKLAFFFPENENFLGNRHLLDIGILREFIDQTECKNFFIEKNDCGKIIKKRNRFSHKGTFGHALLFSGSEGKMGAAILSAHACLRAGSGLVTAHIPRSGINIVQSAIPEAMVDIDANDSIFTEVPDLSVYSAIAVGPGIGTAVDTQKALKLLIQNTSIPLVVDADAINILGENRTWLSFIPKESIFTPHMKEFERLTGKTANDFDRNQRQREFSVRYGVYVILKGAFTAITTPSGDCFFNPTGNPGMATGGSGDVLTGLIAGLMAQGYSSLESAVLGVYLHGLAGDLAMEQWGQESLIASDIINKLGKAFISLYGQ